MIESDGSEMYGTLFTAQGKGDHSTAVILHGFPGHERNLDLAHTLRRGGINSLIFHYRGSWGSRGTFSFSGMLADTARAVDDLRNEGKAYGVNPDDILIIGHSMGGWAGAITAAADERIGSLVLLSPFNMGMVSDWALEDDLNREMVRRMFKELSRPMNTIGHDRLLEEVMEHRRDWNLLRHAEELSGKRILIVSARNDTLSIPELHTLPLYEELVWNGCSDVEHVILDSDHSFSDARIELQRTVWRWIERGLRRNERRTVRA